MSDDTRSAQDSPAVGSPLDGGVGRLQPERAGFLAQIEACHREVAQWPDWMRQERTAPAWMIGWDADDILLLGRLWKGKSAGGHVPAKAPALDAR